MEPALRISGPVVQVERMDDLYAINSAKTEFRDAFNEWRPERLIALLDPGVVYFNDRQLFAIGPGTADAVHAYFRELAEKYASVRVAPIIIEIRLEGPVAYDYGWHEWTFTPKDGSAPVFRKDRYVDIWHKNAIGQWKLWMYMNNVDVPMQLAAGA